MEMTKRTLLAGAAGKKLVCLHTALKRAPASIRQNTLAILGDSYAKRLSYQTFKKKALGLMVQSAFCHENNICQKKAGARL